MKKIISVLLAALMLVSCFSVVSFAEGETCTCEPGVHIAGGPCHCCVYCPDVDPTYVMECYTKNGGFCCDSCDGMYPCNCGAACGCKFCVPGDQNIEDGDNTLDKVVTDQDKQNFVDGFQAILKTISDFFDELFDTIFEFLRLDDVLGRGDNPEA